MAIKNSILILCGLVLLPLFSSAQDIGCFVPGACGQSTEVGISFPSDSNGCLQDCKDNAACFYFSYNFEDDLCVAFTECDVLVDPYTNLTVSGHVSCDLLFCGEDGQCEGTILGVEQLTTAEDCNDFCVSNPRCSWWSFHSDEPFCSIFEDCERVDTSSCSDCIYGQRECQEGASATNAPGGSTTPAGPSGSNTLLVFGDTTVVDVISLEGKTCDPVANAPINLDYSYGFTTNGGATPNVCVDDICYTYDGSTWSQISGPNYDHYLSAGAQIDDETYFVLGGYYSNYEAESYNSASGTWSTRQDCPEDLYSHCAAQVDGMVYIGGDGGGTGGGYTDFYVYDYAADSYTTLTNVPYSHNNAMCGIVQTASNGPEFVIAGDYDYIDIYNINAGTWRTASNSISSDVTGAAYVQYGDTFLAMGGSSSGLGIYQYDPTTEYFFLRSETLNFAQSYYPSALLIDGSILNCK